MQTRGLKATLLTWTETVAINKHIEMYFLYYLPLEKSEALNLNKLHSRMLWAKIILNWPSDSGGEAV